VGLFVTRKVNVDSSKPGQQGAGDQNSRESGGSPGATGEAFVKKQSQSNPISVSSEKLGSRRDRHSGPSLVSPSQLVRIPIQPREGPLWRRSGFGAYFSEGLFLEIAL